MAAAPMDSKGARTTFSEEEFGKRMDRCLTDVLMKATGGMVMGAALSLLFFRRKKWPFVLGGGIGTGGGLVIGSVVSVLFLRRRAWPIILGTGFGTGVAYRNCERELNN